MGVRSKLRKSGGQFWLCRFYGSHIPLLFRNLLIFFFFYWSSFTMCSFPLLINIAWFGFLIPCDLVFWFLSLSLLLILNCCLLPSLRKLRSSSFFFWNMSHPSFPQVVLMLNSMVNISVYNVKNLIHSTICCSHFVGNVTPYIIVNI